MGWWSNAVTRSGRAAPAEVEQRKMALFLTVAAVLGSVPSLIRGQVQDSPIETGSGILLFIVAAGSSLFLTCEGKLTQKLVLAYLASMVLVVIGHDLSARTLAPSAEVWLCFVLVVDAALILRLHHKATSALIAVCVAWLVLAELESLFRFGLFDIPGTPSQETRMERQVRVTSCSKPPCSAGMEEHIARAMLYSVIFILDFITKRRFADGLERETASMQRTIDATQRIATGLSAYDIDTVASILDSAHLHLPPHIYEALRSLEQNLRLYRPYLPHALFEVEGSRDSNALLMAAPPGIDTQEATIAFTDIRSSTAIWAASSDSMKKAIRIHNSVIRRTIDTCSGYEVKTVGDSFMVAFDDVTSGLNFALAVHEALLSADWPTPLLEIPLCARQSTVWGGLTVRVGVNSGPVTTEENALTHRMDYFGNTVNLAARLEGACPPGAVATTEELWETAAEHCHPSMAEDIEQVTLKGVRGNVSMQVVWPAALAERRFRPLVDRVHRAPSSIFQSMYSSLGGGELSQREPHLKSLHASVCVVQLAVHPHEGDAAGGFSSKLHTLSTCADRSAGTVLTVLGSFVAVGWNLARPVTAHGEAALRFAHFLRRSISEGIESLGMATGTVLYGDVGGSTQRFVNAVGPPVRASWSLCVVAEEQGHWCLYAYIPDSSVGHLPAALRRQLRNSGVVPPFGVSSRVYQLPVDGGTFRCASFKSTITVPAQPPEEAA